MSESAEQAADEPGVVDGSLHNEALMIIDIHQNMKRCFTSAGGAEPALTLLADLVKTSSNTNTVFIVPQYLNVI